MLLNIPVQLIFTSPLVNVHLCIDGKPTKIAANFSCQITDERGIDITHKVRNFSLKRSMGHSRDHAELELIAGGFDGPFCVAAPDLSPILILPAPSGN